jgi:hypothetical protein
MKVTVFYQPKDSLTETLFNPNSAVQGDTGIKGRTLRNEGNRSVANSGLQAPVL